MDGNDHQIHICWQILTWSNRLLAQGRRDQGCDSSCTATAGVHFSRLPIGAVMFSLGRSLESNKFVLGERGVLKKENFGLIPIMFQCAPWSWHALCVERANLEINLLISSAGTWTRIGFDPLFYQTLVLGHSQAEFLIGRWFFFNSKVLIGLGQRSVPQRCQN